MAHPPLPGDAATPLDELPMTPFHARVVALCVLVSVLDGLDTQVIGVAAPSIAADLGMSLTGFGPVFSAGLLGAMLGALALGGLADRVGRKRVLIAATLVFAAFTLATPLAVGPVSLAALRFLAGLGLGGATPCFLALAAEYAPRRSRATVVSLTWAGFPLGGVLAGFGSSWLLEAFPWQVLFYVGGLLPLALAALLAFGLPESVGFLLLRGRVEEARRILRRAAPGLSFDGLQPAALGEGPARGTVGRLFADGRALTTLLLWVPFFMAFGALIVVVLWTPALLRAGGMPASAAAVALGFHGVGALVGMAAAGRLVARFGAVRALVPALCIGAACTVGLGHTGHSAALASLFMALVGVFVGIGASGAIALAALAYPTGLRSTGIGWAMAMGRAGQVLSPLLAGALLAAGLGLQGVFLVVGAAPLVAALFVLLLALRTRARAPATGVAAEA